MCCDPACNTGPHGSLSAASKRPGPVSCGRAAGWVGKGGFHAYHPWRSSQPSDKRSEQPAVIAVAVDRAGRSSRAPAVPLTKAAASRQLRMRGGSGGQDAEARETRQPQVGVGARHSAPLRVAPEAGDVIVGLTEACHTSSLVEAVWDACFLPVQPVALAGRSGGRRIYVRTGQQTWNGALTLPAGSNVRIIGPTSAQLCGSWLLEPECAGTFTGTCLSVCISVSLSVSRAHARARTHTQASPRSGVTTTSPAPPSPSREAPGHLRTRS